MVDIWVLSTTGGIPIMAFSSRDDATAMQTHFHDARIGLFNVHRTVLTDSPTIGGPVRNPASPPLPTPPIPPGPRWTGATQYHSNDTRIYEDMDRLRSEAQALSEDQALREEAFLAAP